MVIIDVREPNEYASGHVEGAINIPVGDIASSDRIASMSKNEDIVVYCRSGGRAGRAKQQLKSLGFEQVVNGINQSSVESNK